jgi:hypothetical protein
MYSYCYSCVRFTPSNNAASSKKIHTCEDNLNFILPGKSCPHRTFREITMAPSFALASDRVAERHTIAIERAANFYGKYAVRINAKILQERGFFFFSFWQGGVLRSERKGVSFHVE